MPPIRNADHDIVYAECALSMKRNKKINRKTYQYNNKKTNKQTGKTSDKILINSHMKL